MNPSWANSRWQWMSGRVSCICSRDVQGAKKAATLFTRKSTELASPCRLQRITLRSGRVHHQMGEAMMGDHALSRRWVGRSGRGYLMWPAGPRVKKAPSTSPQPQPQRPARAREPTFDHHDMCSTSPLHAQPHAEAEPSLRPAGRSVVRARRVAYVRTSADVWCVRVEYGFWFSLAPRCHVGYGRTMPSYCGNACMRCSSRKGKTEKWERRIIEVRAHMLCWSLPCVCVCVRVVRAAIWMWMRALPMHEPIPVLLVRGWMHIWSRKEINLFDQIAYTVELNSLCVCCSFHKDYMCTIC